MELCWKKITEEHDTVEPISGIGIHMKIERRKNAMVTMLMSGVVFSLRLSVYGFEPFSMFSNMMSMLRLVFSLLHFQHKTVMVFFSFHLIYIVI